MTHNTSVNYHLISSIKNSLMNLGDQSMSIADQMAFTNPLKLEYLKFAECIYNTCIQMTDIQLSHA